MNTPRIWLLLVPLLALLSETAFGQSEGMQSDWLELVKGYRDGKSGAQIMDVSEDPSTGNQTVLVKIPKVSVDENSTMEEVRVIGKAPEKAKMPELFPELETEWVDDYDNDHYGLLVKLYSDQKIPFRLFFSAEGQGGSINNSVRP
jgi:hypothetical protein